MGGFGWRQLWAPAIPSKPEPWMGTLPGTRSFCAQPCASLSAAPPPTAPTPLLPLCRASALLSRVACPQVPGEVACPAWFFPLCGVSLGPLPWEPLLFPVSNSLTSPGQSGACLGLPPASGCLIPSSSLDVYVAGMCSDPSSPHHLASSFLLGLGAASLHLQPGAEFWVPLGLAGWGLTQAALGILVDTLLLQKPSEPWALPHPATSFHSSFSRRPQPATPLTSAI